MYANTCRTCGTEYSARIARQIYCSPSCRRNGSRNRSRARIREDHSLNFVGVDGEGVDRPDGTHEYIMLSVGSRTLCHAGIALSIGDILSFLWQCNLETPTACFVGFFLGYDFTMWLRQLPQRQAYLLFDKRGIAERTSARKSAANRFPDPVVFGEWEMDIMAGRRFKLRPHKHVPSRYTPTCRNRTCDFRMEYSFGDVATAGEPVAIVRGEMEWEVNPESPILPFPGWSVLTSLNLHPESDALSGSTATPPSSIRKSESSGWMFICDTGSFWQTSFLNVIDPKKWEGEPVCTPEEYETVKRGKADRSRVAEYGDDSFIAVMAEYNVLENDLLARVTSRLNKGFMNDDIPIRIKRNEWYGPGRAAQAWIDMLHNRIASPDAVSENRGRSDLRNDTRGTYGVSQRRNEMGLLSADVYSSMPSWFVDAARSSYYGGWFEQFAHGHVGDVWEYDINSAYPFVIASLPCLHTESPHDGQYAQGNGPDTPDGPGRQYTLVYATISGSDPFIGVMPFRTRTGHILRPHEVTGWYWLHEVEASRRAGLVDRLVIHEWASYTPCTCTPPFNPPDIGIERMYRMRLEVGKDTPAGKAFKLVYNSAYGKTAQSIGSPKYSNPVYASLITAGCRTLILEAIATHPRGSASVSMVATDGVYFLERHPALPLSNTALGAWQEKSKPGMTQLMPGVYWDDKTRERVRQGLLPEGLKSRGVPARDLAHQIEYLDVLFADMHFCIAEGYEPEWPTIAFQQAFNMVTAKAAMARGDWNAAGRVTHNTTRNISANPFTKRIDQPYRDEHWGGIIRTPVYPRGPGGISIPYDKSFGFDPDSNVLEELDRDGRDSLSYFRDLIND